MKSMKKRLLSMFAAAAMTFCSVMPEPFAVHAEKVIEKLTVKGIQDPVYMEKPVTDPAAYTLDIPDQAEIAWVKWTDLRMIEKLLKKGVTNATIEDVEIPAFMSTFSVAFIGLKAKDGYSFSKDLVAFRDSESFDNMLDINYDIGLEKDLGIKMPECDLFLTVRGMDLKGGTIVGFGINGIENVYGADCPTALSGFSTDDHVDFDWVEWYVLSLQKGWIKLPMDQPINTTLTNVEGGDVFVFMGLHAQDGYTIPSDSKIYFYPDTPENAGQFYVRQDTLKAEQNLYPNLPAADYVFGKYVHLDYKKTISQVTIHDMPLPVAGEKPDTTLSHYQLQQSTCHASNVFWFDENKKVMSDKSVFEAGKSYFATLYLEPNHGYEFDYTLNENTKKRKYTFTSACAVSGVQATTITAETIDADGTRNIVPYIRLECKASATTKLGTKLAVTGLREPIEDEPAFGQVLPAGSVNIDHCTTKIEWQNKKWFNRGENNTVRISVIPDYGYTFDLDSLKNYTGTINGKKATVEAGYADREYDRKQVRCIILSADFKTAGFTGETCYFKDGSNYKFACEKGTVKKDLHYTWTGSRYDPETGTWENDLKIADYTDEDYNGYLFYYGAAKDKKLDNAHYDHAYVECRIWSESEGTITTKRFHLHALADEMDHSIYLPRPKIGDRFTDIYKQISLCQFRSKSENGDYIRIYECNGRGEHLKEMQIGDLFRAGYCYDFAFQVSLPESVERDVIFSFDNHGLDFYDSASSGNYYVSPAAEKVDLKKLTVADHWLSPLLLPDDTSKCGDNLTWGYILPIPQEGIESALSISGSGDMYNYLSDLLPPWATNSSYDILKNAQNIWLPDACTHIGDFAFYDMDNVKTVKLPHALKSIGDAAFSACSALESIEIPYQTESIGIDAFSGCPNLKEIVFWNPDTEIYDHASTISSSIRVGKDEDGYTLVQYGFSGTIVGFEGSKAQEYAAKYNRKFRSLGAKPDGMCGDHLYWYYDSEKKKLTIEGEGDMYDSYHFIEKPEEVRELSLPEGLTSIGQACFFRFGIDELQIPEKVVSIGADAFGFAMNLNAVVVPASVTTVGDQAFFGTNLSDIIFMNRNVMLPDNERTFIRVKDTSIPNSKDYVFDGIVHGYKNSSAQEYAEIYGFRFEPITVAECTITFDAGSGSGEMESVTVEKDSSFTLPENGFTPPKDKRFAGWLCDGILCSAGTEITVTTDLTITACWKPIGRMRTGDVSGNDSIDTQDAMLLTRYVNGWEGIEIELDAADIDLDGTVGVRDAMILTRYVNGWEGYDSYFTEP